MTSPATRWSIPALIITLAALVGMGDSFFLVLEYIEAIVHPGQLTPCTVNSLVSCTLTVQGEWAHYIPGVPNPMWGMLWYAGAGAYGLTLLLGSRFTKSARAAVFAILLAGIAFSYRLYLASILELGGVCPFCLTSTTGSTLILLAFIVDDLRHEDPVIGRIWKWILYAFQAFSVTFFVVGLPWFIGSGLKWIPDKMAAITHWSFPLMVSLVCFMAAGHLWALKALRASKR
ncbi:MAG: hypothetical protein KBC95_03545 [Candidatus Peribacteraceae bacterium]|nr:hypothetical protein [Candidatus Peribacteraceae bacterium]